MLSSNVKSEGPNQLDGLRATGGKVMIEVNQGITLSQHPLPPVLTKR